MDKLLDAFTSAFGGRFMYDEPGHDRLYLAPDDAAYITPEKGLDLLISESLASSRNLIIERCALFEYIPGLDY